MAKRWSAEEDNILREHYSDKGFAWVTNMLQGRSRTAVAKRAMKLGIRGRQWAGAEDYVLRRCYRQFGATYCRRYMPRRSEIAIMSRARRLGLVRDIKLKYRDLMEAHDEIACQQAAIEIGLIPKPDDLPEGFFDLMAKC
ncbi:MAG: hypothetical protein G8D81_16780 [gamma proteobacterium symbiont of Clathrolucina costata]